MDKKDQLIKYLEDNGVIRTKSVKRSFAKVDRKDFLLDEYVDLAYENTPAPIGFEQKISQPYTVAFMLELLDIKLGDKVMEVGSGSGWLSGLLAEIVGEKGVVYAVEIIEQLCIFGRNNLTKYHDLSKRVKFFCQSADDGLPEIAQKIGGFDAIVSSAEINFSPKKWREQLKSGGVLIYPRANGIFKETKISEDMFNEKFYPGFTFVPYLKD